MADDEDEEVMTDADFEKALDALREREENGDVGELLKIMNENRMISWEEAEQILGDTQGPVKSSLPEQTRPSEPDNDTDVEQSIKKLLDDDPSLKQINLNNMKRTPIPQLRRLIEAMAYNTHLEKLSLANMGLYDNNLDILITVVEMNQSLKSLNLETNYLSGDFFSKLFKAALVNQTLEEIKAVNQGVSFATTAEKEIIDAVQKNKGLCKVSVNLRLPEGRHKIENATLRNGEIRRVLRRQAAQAAKEEEERQKKEEEERKVAEAAKKVEEEKKAAEPKKPPPTKPKIPAAPLTAMPLNKPTPKSVTSKPGALDKTKLIELERRASLECPLSPPVVAAAPRKSISKSKDDDKETEILGLGTKKKTSVVSKKDEETKPPPPPGARKPWERPAPATEEKKKEPTKEEVQKAKKVWERPAPKEDKPAPPAAPNRSEVAKAAAAAALKRKPVVEEEKKEEVKEVPKPPPIPETKPTPAAPNRSEVARAAAAAALKRKPFVDPAEKAVEKVEEVKEEPKPRRPWEKPAPAVPEKSTPATSKVEAEKPSASDTATDGTNTDEKPKKKLVKKKKPVNGEAAKTGSEEKSETVKENGKAEEPPKTVPVVKPKPQKKDDIPPAALEEKINLGAVGLRSARTRRLP